MPPPPPPAGGTTKYATPPSLPPPVRLLSLCVSSLCLYTCHLGVDKRPKEKGKKHFSRAAGKGRPHENLCHRRVRCNLIGGTCRGGPLDLALPPGGPKRFSTDSGPARRREEGGGRIRKGFARKVAMCARWSPIVSFDGWVDPRLELRTWHFCQADTAWEGGKGEEGGNAP